MENLTIVGTPTRTFDHREIEIAVTDKPIRGVLNGSNQSWEFTSTDPIFLETYPSGAMYSFTIFDENDTSNEYAKYHAAMSKKIEQLLNGC